MKKLKLSNVTENAWTELGRLGRTLQNKILLEFWITVYSYKYLEEIDEQKVSGSNELGLFKDLKEGPGEKKMTEKVEELMFKKQEKSNHSKLKFCRPS